MRALEKKVGDLTRKYLSMDPTKTTLYIALQVPDTDCHITLCIAHGVSAKTRDDMVSDAQATFNHTLDWRLVKRIKVGHNDLDAWKVEPVIKTAEYAIRVFYAQHYVPEREEWAHREWLGHATIKSAEHAEQMQRIKDGGGVFTPREVYAATIGPNKRTLAQWVLEDGLSTR